MPELPEVEIARSQLERWCVGRVVTSIGALAGPPLRGPSDLSALVGQLIIAIDRVGKQMAIQTR